MNLELLKNKTMSSLEIAKLTNKRHDNILRDIQSQLGKLPGGILRFEDTYQNQQNKQLYKKYELPYRETMILVSGYSVELRSAIIDRWIKLETELSQLENERKEARKIRRDFTDTLKDHGIHRPVEYAMITNNQKDKLKLGRKPKSEMTAQELSMVKIAELMAKFHLTDSKVNGYNKVNPITEYSAEIAYENTQGMIDARQNLISELNHLRANP